MTTSMSNEKNILHIDAVSHAFIDEDSAKATPVLHDISFEVKEGEFFSVLGPSGCGKSTLLRIIAGMVLPQKGIIGFKDNETKEKLGMIFQSFALFPWLTAHENIEFGLKMKDIDHTVRKHIVKERLGEVGLTGFEHAYPKDLSGGMKQRVGIARALVLNPSLLLMDEAFSALDAFTAERLRKEVLQLWTKEKMSIVMVRHLVEEAVEMSDRVLVMTPRPGAIEAIVDINLPRPRDTRSHEFFGLVDKINSLVKIKI